MFTRKNKGGNIIRNKKTRKGGLQKGGGLTAEEEKTYYETLVSIIYDSDLETNFGVAVALLDSLKETTEYIENDQNTMITFLKESLDLINQYDKIDLYNHADIQNSLSSDDKDRIKLLNDKYATSITNLKEQVNRVFSQIIFKYSGELTNDKTLLYMLLNELTIYNNNNINKGFDKTKFSNFLNVQTTTVTKTVTTTNNKNLISDLNIFPPDNSQNSCWLNSILMALMVPVYLDGNKEENTLRKIKKFEKFKTYIDSYLAQNVNRPKGTQALQEIKRSIFFGNDSIKNQFHNVNSFLENILFNTYFNNSMNIEKTVYDIKDESNKDTLSIPLHGSEQKFTIMFSREETVKYTDRDDKIIFSIDKNEIHKSYQYEIKTNLKYLIFQCDGEGNFSDSLRDLFLKETLKIGSKTYKRVSFVLASGGHYVSVVKKNNLYYLINDLPPTITVFDKNNVTQMIRNRSTKIQNYYYLNVIVYMLDETQPIVDNSTKPIVDNSTKPIVDNSTKPIVDNSTKPIVDNSTKPIVDNSTKPIVDNSTKPIVDNSTKPIVDNSMSSNLNKKDLTYSSIKKGVKIEESLTKPAIESQPILTTNNITDSLIKSANVAIESQTKSELEVANNSNSQMVSQPTQSVKTYTIEFDATGNVKIVADIIQTSGQSLSDEIEDHYFNKNPVKYIPKNTNYTVTVTKDQAGKTIIEI
jgi:hypothetical protein